MPRAVVASERPPNGSAARADGAVPYVDTSSQPSPFEWLAAVAATVIQQGAFISVPTLVAGASIDPSIAGATPNPINTLAVAANGLVIGALCLAHRRQVTAIVRGNWASVWLAMLILASTIWSIHPEVTFRRGGGYVITLLTAVYLSSRFTTDQAIKVLSWGLALSAFGSLVFVAVYPQYGIMHDADPGLQGAWRGVFAAKNPFGYAMCVGVLVGCYIIAGASTAVGRRARLLDLAILGCFVALVVLARSATALLCSVFFLIGACIYVLWIRARPMAAIAATALALLGLLGLVLVWVDPTSGLALIGKNATLTGRTDFWPLVVDLIRQKPLLGWGYGAMWLAGDDTSVLFETTIAWLPSGAHNEFLEVALELGLLGAAVASTVIGVALWRGASCLLAGRHQLGVFLLVFVLATLAASITEAELVENQSIAWVAFNVLCFSAGLEIAQVKAREKNRRSALRTPILSRAKPIG